MKIVIAADIFPPDIGGPATHSSSVGRELVSRGHEVRVICYQDSEKKLGHHNFLVKKVDARRNLFAKYFLYTFKLFLMALRADVIYAMGPVNAGLPALIVSKITFTKLIVKVVGDYAWEQDWVQYKHEHTVEEFQVKRTKGKIRLFKLIESLVTKHADTVITPSKYLQKIVAGWGVKSKNIKVIYNSFSIPGTSHYASTEKAKEMIGIRGKIVLTICRFVPWKGLDMLIEIWPEILEAEPKMKLVMIGGGAEYDRLIGKVAEMNLTESVLVFGQIPRRELPVYYNAADMFVLNSGYEGLAHVLLEALYFKLPVILSNVGGNMEVLIDEHNGFLVPYNDKEEWKKAILRIATNPKLKKQFAEQRIMELKDFSFDHMVDTIEMELKMVSK